MNTIDLKASRFSCVKKRGGKSPLWLAFHMKGWGELVGKGPTAEDAIQDYRKQYRAHKGLFS